MDLGLFEMYYIYSQIDDYEQEQKRKESEDSYRNYLEYTSGMAPEIASEKAQGLAFEDLPRIVRVMLCLLYLIYKAFAFVFMVAGYAFVLLIFAVIIEWLLF